jgi:hypothetical protein
MGFTLIDAGGAGAPGITPDYTIKITENVSSLWATYKMVSRSNLAQQVEGQFPIPRKGRFIQVTNNLGVKVIAPKLIFNLGF